MMNRILQTLTLLSALFFSAPSPAQTPSWIWAQSFGGNESDYANRVAIDRAGNVYLVGTSNTDTAHSQHNAFKHIDLIKYNRAGRLVWFRQFGGGNLVGDAEGLALAIDPQGRIVIGGSFASDSLRFGNTLLRNTGTGTDLFLAKIEPYYGVAIWAASASGSGNDLIADLTIDDAGSMYVLGAFSGPTLAAGAVRLQNSNSNPSAARTSDLMALKYNASGTALWGKPFGGTGNETPRTIAVSDSNHIYIGGSFLGSSFPIGGSTLVNVGAAGTSDGFAARLDHAGNPVWARAYSGPRDYDEVSSIAAGKSGSCYVAGTFFSDSILVAGQWRRNSGSSNTSDFFLTRYDSSGTQAWLRAGTGKSYEFANAVCVDRFENVSLCGLFSSDTAAVGPLFAVNRSSNPTAGQLLIVRFDSSGNPVWIKSGTSRGSASPHSAAVNPAGDVICAGGFDGDYIRLDSLLIGNANYSRSDAFVARIGSLATTVPDRGAESSVHIFPNPTTGTVTIFRTDTQPAMVQLFNVQGMEAYRSVLSGKESKLDISALPKGAYWLIIRDPGAQLARQILLR